MVQRSLLDSLCHFSFEAKYEWAVVIEDFKLLVFKCLFERKTDLKLLVLMGCSVHLKQLNQCLDPSLVRLGFLGLDLRLINFGVNFKAVVNFHV